jgi:hypothetical protein
MPGPWWRPDETGESNPPSQQGPWWRGQQPSESSPGQAPSPSTDPGGSGSSGGDPPWWRRTQSTQPVSAPQPPNPSERSVRTPTRPSPRASRFPRIAIAIIAIVVLLGGGGGIAYVLARGSGPDRTPVAPSAVVNAVDRTKSARTAHFALNVPLSAPIAMFFGEAGAVTLQGSGQVDFVNRTASWTLTLPTSFGGNLEAAAAGGTTFVHIPEFSAGKRPWVALRTAADYSSFDHVPLIRDLVTLTNPMRALNILDSSKPRRGSSLRPPEGPASAVQLAYAPASADQGRRPVTTPAQKATVSCGADQSGSSQVLDGTAPPDGSAADVFTLGSTADTENQTLKSWAHNKISADAGPSGVCSLDISLENADANGFDVKFDFTGTGEPVKTDLPQTKITTDWEVVYTYHVSASFCNEGTWVATSHSTVPGSGNISPFVGGGTVELTIAGGSSSLVTDEVYVGTIEVPNPFFGFPDLGPQAPFDTYNTRATRMISATGSSFWSSDAGGSGSPRPTSGEFTAIVNGSADLTTFNDYTGNTIPQTVDRQYTLSGTFNCTGGAATLGLDGRTFGHLDFTRTSSPPLPVVHPPTVDSSQTYRVWRTPKTPPSSAPSTTGG